MPRCKCRAQPSLTPRSQRATQLARRQEARTERGRELGSASDSAMNVRELLARRPRHAAAESSFWFARNSQSILFLIIVLACVGAYLAFTIPIAVFPTTDFPRIIVG